MTYNEKAWALEDEMKRRATMKPVNNIATFILMVLAVLCFSLLVIAISLV